MSITNDAHHTSAAIAGQCHKPIQPGRTAHMHIHLLKHKHESMHTQQKHYNTLRIALHYHYITLHAYSNYRTYIHAYIHTYPQANICTMYKFHTVLSGSATAQLKDSCGCEELPAAPEAATPRPVVHRV